MGMHIPHTGIWGLSMELYNHYIIRYYVTLYLREIEEYFHLFPPVVCVKSASNTDKSHHIDIKFKSIKQFSIITSSDLLWY